MIAVLGYLYQGDYSIPILLSEELRRDGIDVIDLSLGAMRAASLLQSLSPEKLILLTCGKKGKKEIRVYKPEIQEDQLASFMDVYNNMRGYFMDLESFFKAANSLGALPEDIEVIECEIELEEGLGLSTWGEQCKEMMKKKVKELLSDDE